MIAAERLPEVVGAGARGSYYDVSDHEVAAGSTLGGPRCTCIVKVTGAIERVYSPEYGKSAIGTLVLHHWDEATGISLAALPGTFRLHPEHQEHAFTLANGVDVHEDVFVLSPRPDGDRAAPPATYFTVRLTNPTAERIRLGTYAFIELRGDTDRDVESRYSKRDNAILAWNASDPSFVRAVTCSLPPTSWEVTLDAGKAVSKTAPGPFAMTVSSPAADPLGVLHHSFTLEPNASVTLAYTVTFSLHGAPAVRTQLRKLPPADEALHATRAYYHEILNRSIVLTPDADVNRGVLWAKANMLRTMLFAPTGWCFVNDPTRTNNSVARDTAWFALGADYIVPEFAEASLLWYAEHLEPGGEVVEYYDIRTGKTADYKLNINDNTPLLILALWHHVNATGRRDFLERVYPAAVKAAGLILAQRNAQGLVWCTATGEADWGICGWRNVISGYRLSGATTELNAECYAALQTVSHMARMLGRHDESARWLRAAEDLRAAINEHLLDPRTGLYYLNIDIDGNPRSNVTSDLVFPVMFGVCDDDTAARIVSRLSVAEFWTSAGIRTVPRDAPDYGPTHGYGLLGGVWVGVAFWYAFAAARFNPEFMARSLSNAFKYYSMEPRRNNTVPGQFSEWLHGETLVNQGMMLSPWFPPRYMWAAIEGAAGLDLAGTVATINPRLAPQWKWLGVRNVIVGGRRIAWFAVRTPELCVYANAAVCSEHPASVYDDDCSDAVALEGNGAVVIAFARGDDRVVLIGNTNDQTVTTALRLPAVLRGGFAARVYNSLRGAWTHARYTAADLQHGIPVELDRQGFCLLELVQEV